MAEEIDRLDVAQTLLKTLTPDDAKGTIAGSPDQFTMRIPRITREQAGDYKARVDGICKRLAEECDLVIFGRPDSIIKESPTRRTPVSTLSGHIAYEPQSEYPSISAYL